MRVLRICAAMVLFNTVMLCSIIATNQPDPHQGLVVWAVINGFAATITQLISLVAACDGD